MSGPWVRLQAAMPHDARILRSGFWGTIAFPAILQIAKLQGWEGGVFDAGDLDANVLAAHMNAYQTNGVVKPQTIIRGLASGLDALIREGALEWVDKTTLRIRNWSKYQKDTTNAARQKAYRKRQKGTE